MRTADELRHANEVAAEKQRMLTIAGTVWKDHRMNSLHLPSEAIALAALMYEGDDNDVALSHIFAAALIITDKSWLKQQATIMRSEEDTFIPAKVLLTGGSLTIDPTYLVQGIPNAVLVAMAFSGRGIRPGMRIADLAVVAMTAVRHGLFETFVECVNVGSPDGNLATYLQPVKSTLGGLMFSGGQQRSDHNPITVAASRNDEVGAQLTMWMLDTFPLERKDNHGFLAGTICGPLILGVHEFRQLQQYLTHPKLRQAIDQLNAVEATCTLLTAAVAREKFDVDVFNYVLANSKAAINQSLRGLIDNIFTFALQSGQPSAVQHLLTLPTLDRNPSNIPCEACYIAAEHGRSEVLQLLIDNGFDFKNFTRAGTSAFSPLEKALTGGHMECLAILLAADKDGTLANEFTSPVGLTPLQIAVSSGKKWMASAVEILLQFGADPTVRFPVSNETLLRCAVAEQEVEVAEMLITAAPQLVDVTHESKTPLMEACERRNLRLIQLLVAAGADKAIRNKHGGTALTCLDMDDIELRDLVDPNVEQSRLEREERRILAEQEIARRMEEEEERTRLEMESMQHVLSPEETAEAVRLEKLKKRKRIGAVKLS